MFNSQGASNSQVEIGLQVAGTNSIYFRSLSADPRFDKLN